MSTYEDTSSATGRLILCPICKGHIKDPVEYLDTEDEDDEHDIECPECCGEVRLRKEIRVTYYAKAL